MNRSLRPKLGRVSVVALIGGLCVLLLIPTAMSLAKGEGRVCVSSAGCPLSPIDPCQRKPAFALVGRCALAVPWLARFAPTWRVCAALRGDANPDDAAL